MHPILHRAIDAWRPLAGRNRLVEGPPVLPLRQASSRRRASLLALIALAFGRRR
jgi:hypothetical protein